MGSANRNSTQFLTPYVETGLQQNPSLFDMPNIAYQNKKWAYKSAVLLQRRENVELQDSYLYTLKLFPNLN